MGLCSEGPLEGVWVQRLVSKTRGRTGEGQGGWIGGLNRSKNCLESGY